MNNILSLFKKNDNINDMLSKMEGSKYSLFCSGVTPNVAALILGTLYNKKSNCYVYVCSNEYKANIIYDKITDILGIDDVNLYVADDFAAVEALVMSPESKQERLATLINIIEKSQK